MTAEPPVDPVEAFANILLRFVRHNARMQASLPEELKQAKAKLDATQPNGKAERMDYMLLANIATIIGPRKEPISMGELSRELSVPLSTATRITDWLVNTGYAERQPDPNDRRVVRVGLTPAGQTIYNMRAEFMKRRFASWLKPLTEEERTTLIQLMQKLTDHMEAES